MLVAAAQNDASNAQLIIAGILGIAVVVLLIAWVKMHPFLSLILGSAVLGSVAGLAVADTIASFTKGVGDTVGSVGLLIALGAMIGGLLADSGGADRVVDTVIGRVSVRVLPWAMAGVAALIGLPLFFEVGVVLLVPVVLLVASRTGMPVLRIGIPALAGLSVLHGLVPPHPGPLVAINALHANLGLTLALGLLVAIPTVIVAGPLFGMFISRRVQPVPPAALIPTRAPAEVELTDYATDEDRELVGVGGGSSREVRVGGGGRAAGSGGSTRNAGVGASTSRAGAPLVDLGEPEPARTAGDGQRPAASAPPPAQASSEGKLVPKRRPGIVPVVITVLLPVVLMLLRALAELTMSKGTTARSVLDVIGTPIVALLVGVIAAMVLLGARAGFNRVQISQSTAGALPAIAGILLIVAAGGGFKQVLVDAGVGNMVADWANGSNFSPLVLAWLVAVGIRLATGSATVATITAAGIVAPLAAGLDSTSVALLALAVGSGSLFFSHLNDAGFWLVKEYFGMSVSQTIKSWSVMETIISVMGLGGVLVLDALL